MTNEAVRIQFETTGEEADAVADELRQQGATDVDVDKQGAGIVDPASLAVYVLAYMAVTAFTHWLHTRRENSKKKGLLIRVLTSGEIQTTELSIPFGQVIIIGPDGVWSKYYDVDTDTKLGEMTSKLTKGLVPSGGIPTSKAEVEKEADTADSKE